MPSKKTRQQNHPEPNYVDCLPKTQIKITEQDGKLDFYQEGRNESKPPPPEIISAIKHKPAVLPPKNAQIPKDIVACGKPVKREETKPTSSWWHRDAAASDASERPITAQAWDDYKIKPESGNNNNNNKESATNSEVKEKQETISKNEPAKSIPVLRALKPKKAENVNSPPIEIKKIEKEKPSLEESNNRATIKPDSKNNEKIYPFNESAQSKASNLENKTTTTNTGTTSLVSQKQLPTEEHKVSHVLEKSTIEEKPESSKFQIQQQGINKEKKEAQVEKTVDIENKENFMKPEEIREILFKKSDFTSPGDCPRSFLHNKKPRLVVLTRIQHFFDFKVRSVDKTDKSDLENLERKMGEWYRENENFIEYDKFFWLGFYAWCKDDSTECHRVQIIGEVSDDIVQVELIDYGNVENVSLQELYPLRVEYLAVPRMCISAKTTFGHLGPFGSTEKQVLERIGHSKIQDFKKLEEKLFVVMANAFFLKPITFDKFKYDEQGAWIRFY